MSKLDDKIDGLATKLKQLRAQKQRQEARQRSLNSRRERREDTRRKILVGAIVLTKIEQGAFDRAQLMHWLEGALVRDDDRRLFGLTRASTETEPRAPMRA